ncbi:GntR family transcriptional regulator [Paenibacillus sp. HB172176]|uniref:GntR family transcriptional regulator n=1 Tax=Paenibacillus sp. HB172176 TaxID=2493690 RepID=UPI00143B5B3F|nr:GntR family transcriptional regulator [Paenibacillus sp. HB172176]
MEVKHKLIEQIKLLKPHVRLPSRNALAKQYNAARTTIERSISELIGEGYLYAKDGSGTYVSEKRATAKHTPGSTFRSVGLIIPDIRHDTYPGILRGVEDTTNRHDINLVICNTDNQTEKQAGYLNKLIDLGIHGLIIVPAIIGHTDLSLFSKLQEAGIPIVFCNRGIDGVEAPKVVSNNFYGAYAAVKHLIGNGCRDIAYISRPAYSTSYERYQGYTSALAEAGLDVDDRLVLFEPTFDTARQGYDSVSELLKRGVTPDGIFCFNDGIAKGACEALGEKGLIVGKDVLVVGYDNTGICESMPVKLTSVQFQTYDIGASAAGLLLDMMNGETVRSSSFVVLQPELVIRQSSNRS